MGFLFRLLEPRGVRRPMHPVRTVKGAATPEAVKQARRVLHPVDNIAYSAERQVITSLRSGAVGVGVTAAPRYTGTAVARSRTAVPRQPPSVAIADARTARPTDRSR